MLFNYVYLTCICMYYNVYTCIPIYITSSLNWLPSWMFPSLSLLVLKYNIIYLPNIFGEDICKIIL